MDSFDVRGPLASGTGFGAFSGFENSGEKVVMKPARSETSWSVKMDHAGIDVYGIPRLMMLTRSWCVGSAPFGVVRTLNLPAVKLRGRGDRCGVPYPSPSPFSPWHCEQFLRYSAFPDSRCASVPMSGLCASTRAVSASFSTGVRSEPRMPAHHEAARRTRALRVNRREVIGS